MEKMTMEELRMTHNEHNQENDCDCEECMEYRRKIKEMRAIIAQGQELCVK
jgi:hypothetical protein